MEKNKKDPNEKSYRSSAFNHYIEKERLVFNTNSTSLIQLNEEQFSDIQRDLFEHFSFEEINSLKQMGFIVPPVDEFEVIERRRENKFKKESSKFGFTILTTTNCNARCPYCYEEGIKHKDASPETIENIKRLILKNRDKQISVSWFGGEPLFNAKMIDEISSFMNVNKINYSSSIVTNGYLADKWIGKFVDWRIRNVQITLDGVGQIYNKVKRYIYHQEENAFDKVINNISMLLNKNIRVAIRLNFDKNNYQEIIDCIEFLKKRFNNHKKLYVYANHIFGPKESYHLDDGTNLYYLITKKLMECGFVKKLYDLRITHKDYFCFVSNPNHVVIDPNGDFFLCEHYVINKDIGSVGSINQGYINQKNYKFWSSLDYPYKKCYNCNYLPMCQGGCKSESLKEYPDSCCLSYLDCLDNILVDYYHMKEQETEQNENH